MRIVWNCLEHDWVFSKTGVGQTILKQKNGRLTLRGPLRTMLTACWLLKCSHRPSEARIRNWSSGRSFCTNIVGSALRIGLLKGPGSLNFGSRGSLLNSALFIYASPMDLETCKSKSRSCHLWLFVNEWLWISMLYYLIEIIKIRFGSDSEGKILRKFCTKA